MAKTSPAQFVKQVRQEAAKVSWPSRKETSVSTMMVFIMVVVASVFFLLVDQVFATAVKFVFGLGG
ncbi:preprotein translocase subunit SecE [Magnetospirillum sp. 64-120]|uniref:preprotein translocase subunit SecE n=1 Tax=Magnetospirillum sp. 64-120 TaxID=1895778 RepID=UPI000925CE9B|nr:preprotein translocase subunit SecE [Magnetospirillum sp. 64-120]OJX81390.1 MAG: preprotein translocase subunit SecE [Magnetospirillum sp. 64-120]